MTSDARRKDEYEAPQLLELGSLDDLTQGTSGGITDAGQDGGS
jgi:hypothetical protein